MKKILIIAVIAAIVCLGVIKVSAASNLPKIPKPDYDMDYILVFEVLDIVSEEYVTYCGYAYYPIVFYPSVESSVAFNNGYVIYSIGDDGEWHEQMENLGGSTVLMSYEINLLYSSHDILDGDGSLYFNATPEFFIEPPKTVTETIEESLSSFWSKTVGNISVLTIAGIAIMAIFIGVKLIPILVHKFL